LSTLLLNRENIEQLIEAVTVNGKLIVENKEDYTRLVRLARAYSKAVKAMINYVIRGVSHTEATKRLYNVLPNYVYLETAYKNAKAIVESLEETNGSKCEIKKFWLASRGSKYDYGNRNIRLIPRENFFEVLIKYPWDGTWIRAKAFFGERYISMLRELAELASRRSEGYGVVISFRKHPRIHVQVPTHLYLKHFSNTMQLNGGGFVAGFDMNSDRINMVVVDERGKIVYMKSMRFSEVVTHGFSAELSKQRRLQALSHLIKLAKQVGATCIAFENLFAVKKRFTGNPTANRKISKFAKRQLLLHGILRSLREGLHVVLVDPRGTTNSEEHSKAMRRYGLDRHMASAYLVALRALSKVDTNQHKQT
jgi:predicted transposase